VFSFKESFYKKKLTNFERRFISSKILRHVDWQIFTDVLETPHSSKTPAIIYQSIQSHVSDELNCHLFKSRIILNDFHFRIFRSSIWGLEYSGRTEYGAEETSIDCDMQYHHRRWSFVPNDTRKQFSTTFCESLREPPHWSLLGIRCWRDVDTISLRYDPNQVSSRTLRLTDMIKWRINVNCCMSLSRKHIVTEGGKVTVFLNASVVC
jgi:hypothetical protein